MRASEILKIAKAEVGYIGKKSNSNLYDPTGNASGKFTKYAQELFEAGYYNGNKNGYDWCAVFVDWLFFHGCGSKAEAMKVKNCGIYGAGVNFIKGAMPGRVFSKPEIGDQILFKDSTGSLYHTGIVSGISGDTVYTIEGNVNSKVVEKEYPITSARIDSYVRPYYEEEPEPEPEPEPSPEEKEIWGNISQLFVELGKEFAKLGEHKEE